MHLGIIKIIYNRTAQPDVLICAMHFMDDRFMNLGEEVIERRSAVHKAQSLGSSLIHTIPAPHQQLPCLEDTALLFKRYQPPNSGLPCVEDTLSFT